MTSENAQKPKDYDCTCQDTKTNGQTSDAYAHRILAVYVEGLRWPEEEHGEEVGAGDEGDDEGQGKNTGCLLQTSWEHGVFGEFRFPNHEGYEQEKADDERY